MPTLYARENRPMTEKKWRTEILKCLFSKKQGETFYFFYPVPLHFKIKSGSPLYVSSLSVGCTPEQTLNPPDIPPRYAGLGPSLNGLNWANNWEMMKSPALESIQPATSFLQFHFIHLHSQNEKPLTCFFFSEPPPCSAILIGNLRIIFLLIGHYEYMLYHM
jgi:hypothetical protein